jgi:sulfur-carrier protein
MPLTVLIFGQLTDITGTNTLEMEPAADTGSLLAALYNKYPGLQQASFVLAVNKQVVQENTLLPNACTVALLPAFSGG